jgi:hypothetical protein
MKIPAFSICILTIIGLASAVSSAQPVQTQPSSPDSRSRPADRGQVSSEAKNPLVVRIDPARVLDSSGQAIGKVENIVLNPSGCAEAAIITGDRGRMIPVPWQVVKVSGETRGQGEAPGAGLTFTINANSDRIMAAPSFARDEWPNVTSVSWLQPSVQFFRSDTAVGGTTESSGSLGGTGASTSTGTVGTNSTSVTGPGAAMPPTGRPGSLNRPLLPPSIPEPVNPGPPNVVPPVTPPPGSIPPPVTPPPPSTVQPDNFPRPVNPPAIP